MHQKTDHVFKINTFPGGVRVQEYDGLGQDLSKSRCGFVS
jgi:hypothetical protein